MFKCKCQEDLLRISDWEADEILGRTHIHNEGTYFGNYLLCVKCNKVYTLIQYLDFDNIKHNGTNFYCDAEFQIKECEKGE